MARGGNIREAQAIMKGFQRQAKKNFGAELNSQVQQQFNQQLGEVYEALNDAADSSGEEELEQVVAASKSYQPQIQA